MKCSSSGFFGCRSEKKTADLMKCDHCPLILTPFVMVEPYTIFCFCMSYIKLRLSLYKALVTQCQIKTNTEFYTHCHFWRPGIYEFYQAYLYLLISRHHKCLVKYKNKPSAVWHLSIQYFFLCLSRTVVPKLIYNSHEMCCIGQRLKTYIERFLSDRVIT